MYLAERGLPGPMHIDIINIIGLLRHSLIRGRWKKIAPTATKKEKKAFFVAVGAIFFHRPLVWCNRLIPTSHDRDSRAQLWAPTGSASRMRAMGQARCFVGHCCLTKRIAEAKLKVCFGLSEATGNHGSHNRCKTAPSKRAETPR